MLLKGFRYRPPDGLADVVSDPLLWQLRHNPGSLPAGACDQAGALHIPLTQNRSRYKAPYADQVIEHQSLHNNSCSEFPFCYKKSGHIPVSLHYRHIYNTRQVQISKSLTLIDNVIPLHIALRCHGHVTSYPKHSLGMGLYGFLAYVLHSTSPFQAESADWRFGVYEAHHSNCTETS